MIRFVVRRVAGFVPVLLAIVTLVFFLVRLSPGGPFDTDKAFSAETRKRILAHYQLDAPLHRQYLHYLQGLLQGDLGPSLTSSFTVMERIRSTFPVSLELGAYALLVALVLGVLAGLVAATRPNHWQDHAAMSLAMTGICVPNIVLGPLLVLVLGIWLRWLPVAGWGQAADKILPSFVLGAAYAAYIARLCRGGMLEMLAQDFIRTARAKGASEWRVVFYHAMRGGIQPVVAYLGPAAAGLLTGSFVVEQIFNVPGLGTEFIRAANNRDYTMVLGTVLVYASLILVFNLVVDLVQGCLDPRVRYDA